MGLCVLRGLGQPADAARREGEGTLGAVAVVAGQDIAALLSPSRQLAALRKSTCRCRKGRNMYGVVLWYVMVALDPVLRDAGRKQAGEGVGTGGWS